MSLPKLNLPPVELRLRSSEQQTTQVWDALRHRWLCLTAEEWVRQHLLHFLIGERGVDAHRIVQEHPIETCTTTLRADIVVYQGAIPVMIIECKAPHIEITQDVFDQVAHYNTIIGARYVLVTNGLKHYCYEVDQVSRRYTFMKNIPHI